MVMQRKIALVRACFYQNIADMLCEDAKDSLNKKGLPFDVYDLPGALEIAPAIALLEAGGKTDYIGYVALACVIRGETSHYDIVATESARGLSELAICKGLAIGNGILTCDNEHQALKRAETKGSVAVEACLALSKLKELE